MEHKVIATKTFTSELVREWTTHSSSIGKHESTMWLSEYVDGSYSIEWDIPALDEAYGIELECEGKVVTGWDGIMSLPTEAIALLEENGFDCSEVKD